MLRLALQVLCLLPFERVIRGGGEASVRYGHDQILLQVLVAVNSVQSYGRQAASVLLRPGALSAVVHGSYR